MALRAVTAALDPLTLTEWRDRVATRFGVAYADMKTAWQNEVNRIINEAHDTVSKEYGHEPWARRVWTIGATDFSSPDTSTGLFELPADLRHIVSIQESENGTGAVGTITTMESWMHAGAGQTSHPWTQQNHPYYFFKAMSDDNPPVQTWQRAPAPTSALTAMTIVGRGIFDILGTSGSSQYTELPGWLTKQLWHNICADILAYRSQYEHVGIELQLADRALAKTQINDAPHGAETTIYTSPPDEFERELG